MQKLASGHATDTRSSGVPGRAGVDSGVQFVPFQDSTKALALAAPTDTQDEKATQATSDSGPRLGVSIMDQVVPSQLYDCDSIVIEPSLPLTLACPIATQESCDVHETDCGKFRLLSAAFGLGTIDQAVPSHDNMRESLAASAALWYSPTAMHVEGSRQDTPPRKLTLADGSGVATSDQLVPSQEAAADVDVWALTPKSVPTAMQKVGEVQEIDPTWAVAVGSIDQLLPSHSSARFALLVVPPIAKQKLGDVHDTADSDPPPADVGTTDHAVPSHRSARLSCGMPNRPTAIQKVGEMHDTEFRNAFAVADSGVGVTDHPDPSANAREDVNKIDPAITQPIRSVRTCVLDTRPPWCV